MVVEEDLYDHEFVENWCYGFEELAERVRSYPVDRVAEITEVDAEDIRAAARCVAQRPSALSMGLAVDQNPNTLQIGHALLSLFAITGNMDVPGGCFMGLPPIFAGMAENAPAAVEEGALEGLAKFGNIGARAAGPRPVSGHERHREHHASRRHARRAREGRSLTASISPMRSDTTRFRAWCRSPTAGTRPCER